MQYFWDFLQDISEMINCLRYTLIADVTVSSLTEPFVMLWHKKVQESHLLWAVPLATNYLETVTTCP